MFFIIVIDLCSSVEVFRLLNENFKTIKNVGKLLEVRSENWWYCFMNMVSILGWDEEVKLVGH